jgi:ATP-dependent Zn protease
MSQAKPRYCGLSADYHPLNQLLAEMDGFDSTKGVITMAATNRVQVKAVDWLARRP